MAATNDILRSWTRPRAVMRNLLALGPREDRALAYLMVGCLVIFVAQWPRLSRRTYLDGTPLDMTQGAVIPNCQGLVITNGVLHDRFVEAVQKVMKEAN